MTEINFSLSQILVICQFHHVSLVLVKSHYLAQLRRNIVHLVVIGLSYVSQTDKQNDRQLYILIVH